MAWARPPGAPHLPSCPMEVLEPRENDYKSLYELGGLPIAGAVCGFVYPLLTNYFRKWPWYTGIWKSAVYAICLGYVGLKAKELREDIYNDKDQVLRQYINLHPEDFPPYRRVLIKDTIKPWEPCR